MVRTLAVAVALAVAPATFGVALAANALDLSRAERVANHVAKLEQRNHFGLRERIGPFKVTRAACERGSTLRRAKCSYNATSIAEGSDGMRWRCGVTVRERLRLNNTVEWRRATPVCVRQIWGAP